MSDSASEPAPAASRKSPAGECEDFLREVVGHFFADLPRRPAELERRLPSGDPTLDSQAFDQCLPPTP